MEPMTRLQFYLRSDEILWLKRRSEKKSTSMAEVVRRLLQREMARSARAVKP